METCNMSGGGIVRASGGASVLGSGAGGGGRISIRALIDVSAELTVIASGGASSSPYTCAGAAGTVYAVHDTSSRLIFDNNDNSVATTTLTPFPPDLSGVHLSQIMILRKTYVGLRQAETNNDVRASSLKLDASSKVTGDTVIIDVRDATIEGSIAGTSEVWLHNSQSGAGLLTAHSGSSMTCSGCALRMSLSGSNVSLHGSITTATVEVKSLQSISHTGTLTVSGVALTIAVDAASIAGTVECTGAACSILVSANATLQLRGSLSCTNGKCSVSLHSGGDLNSTASMSCAGNSQCLVDIASGSSALLGGSIAGSDIRMLVAGSLQIQGLVSTSGQGYAESSGDGKGSRPAYSSYSSSFRVSGSGAGHGGNGANGCYRYSSGQLPTGGGSYGSSSDPRTFGSGGGRGCYYYGSCTSQYGAGGRGGGRIYMNASTIEIASGATVSADGTQGATYSSYVGGGGGSGGSILMETCNMSGGGGSFAPRAGRPFSAQEPAVGGGFHSKQVIYPLS